MIIVTGALGFIGSNIVKELNKQGIKDIILVDEMKPAHNIIGCEYKVLMEMRDFYSNFKDWKKVKCVFHQGAISSTTETNKGRIDSYNIKPSIKLLHDCLEHDIMFSYASSAGVYGTDLYFAEDAELNPKSLYAESKSIIDKKVEEILKVKPDAKIQGWRYFNVYGDGEQFKGDQASPIHKFTRQAIDKRKIYIFEGSENYKRDFVWVGDVVRTVVESSKEKFNGIYNLGTGTAISFKEVAEIIAFKYNAEIEEIAFPKKLEGQYQIFTKADMRKLESVTTFSSFLSVEQYVVQS